MLVKSRQALAMFLTLLASVVSPVATAQPISKGPVREDVRYSSVPDTVIAATLEKPPSTFDRLPVVVIISGTGPWTRSGWEKMRASLHAAGLATLVYDKRGLGQSTGTFVDTIPVMERCCCRRRLSAHAEGYRSPADRPHGHKPGCRSSVSCCSGRSCNRCGGNAFRSGRAAR